MACIASTPAIEAGDLFNEVLAASSYNRELNRLVALCRRLRDRLDAFANMEPALELVNGLEARGMGRALAAMGVVEFLSGSDGPAAAQQAALALVWSLGVAADQLEGDALRVTDWQG